MIYIIVDYVEHGALLSNTYRKVNKLKKKQTLSNEKIRKYYRQLVLGLDYIHNFANVVHRDIKPENLLIDKNDNLKIADFGISTIFENINIDD